METLTETFPRNGTPEEQLRFLLRFALLAPSSHNTQPWLWEIRGDEISLFADRSRLLPSLDPEGRELLMSCGAALENLRIAMHAFGCKDQLTLFPDSQQPDLLARLRLVESDAPSEGVLFDAITRRHTNRKPFLPQALESELLEALQSEAKREGAWLHFFTDANERDVVAGLIAVGEDMQACSKTARHDIAEWMTPNASTRRDGIPGYAQGIGDAASLVSAVRLRVFGPVEGQADYVWELAEKAPVLVVLGTDDEGPQFWLAAGRALTRVLLRATAEGLSASFFSQPIQIHSLWSELRRIMQRNGVPQLIFRLGYAEGQTPATPRRAVEDVTISE